MKYLLILFGLSSVLASNHDSFLKELYSLRTNLRNHGEYRGLVSICLDNFIQDYLGTKQNYTYAWNQFFIKKLDNGFSCYEMTNPNQKLGLKIESARIKSIRK